MKVDCNGQSGTEGDIVFKTLSHLQMTFVITVAKGDNAHSEYFILLQVQLLSKEIFHILAQLFLMRSVGKGYEDGKKVQNKPQTLV